MCHYLAHCLGTVGAVLLYLLNVRSQLGKGLSVRQNGSGSIAQEADIPNGSQPQLHWNVLLKGSIPEVLVHVPCTYSHRTVNQTLVIRV